MKKLMFVLIGVILLANCQAATFSAGDGNRNKTQDSKESVTISSTPGFFEVASKLAADYATVAPLANITVKKMDASESGTAAAADLVFLSGYDLPGTEAGSSWKMVIGRDAIVPVFNASNPYLSNIISQGVTSGELAGVFGNAGSLTWAALLGGNQEKIVSAYLIDKGSLTATVARFLNLDAPSVKGIAVAGGPELISAIQKDPYAIGFCRLSDLTGNDGQLMAENIGLLPIDRNSNGKMDYVENIYGNVDALSRGIWIGKYPKELCGNIYAVSSTPSVGLAETAFLKYVLTGGQQTIEANGFNSLFPAERLSRIDHLPAGYQKVSTDGGINLFQLLVTLTAVLLLFLAILTLVIRYRKASRRMIRNSDPQHINALNQAAIAMPGGLYFDKSHTWAFMEKDGTVRIGIDDFLQHVTGALTSIKLKSPGDKVRKGEPLLTLVQKGKRLTINAPVSGIIRAENLILFTDPSLVNSSPYTQGWIYQIEPTNWMRETQFLFMAERYGEWLKSEFARLKDFLANAIRPEEPQYACVVLQDGGEIADHILENLGPEVWEDFQTKFIDTSK